MQPSIDIPMTTVTESSYSTLDFPVSDIQDAAHMTLSQGAHNRVSHYGGAAIAFDPPMSFRHRHRFLDGVYDSHPDPEQIPAKRLDSISRQAGLSMEEVLLWFEDEKSRREKLLARHQPQLANHQFPLSPHSITSPGPNSTVTLAMTPNNATSVQNLPQLQDNLSTFASSATTPGQTVPLRGRRGRPPKSQSKSFPESPSSPPEAKRQKLSCVYPCMDCGRSFAADRWSEHVKRVHFPDQVWECPKQNERNGKLCISTNPKPFFRPDNFATHLRGEHGCSDSEISQLKVTCRFAVVGFFHKICGICNDALTSRDESIDHIKDHFRAISQRTYPPEDFGASEWKEKCGSEHRLQRGVHYKFKNSANRWKDRSNERDDSEGPGEDSSDSQNPGNSGDQSGDNPHQGGDNGSSDDNGFYSSQDFDCMDFGQYSSQNCGKTTEHVLPDQPVFGLEGLTLPFTSLRMLGRGAHGTVDEVASAGSKETFARKSVLRRHADLSNSSHMAHLKNELAILKELSHPHLVKLVGAYTDSEYSQIIMSPVADQNLADYMRSTVKSQPQLLRWMGCLSSAMAYLHSREVQHFDIKPQNILVKGENVLLADFGTAKSFNDLTDDSILSLTPMYGAPETIICGCQDYMSDVFSLGCVFSEMMTRIFGRSIRDFEAFRAVAGNTAFYVTLETTRDWIRLELPRVTSKDSVSHCMSEDFKDLLQGGVIQMLSENPQERPNPGEIQACLSSFDRCDACGTFCDSAVSSAAHQSNRPTTHFSSLDAPKFIRDRKAPTHVRPPSDNEPPNQAAGSPEENQNLAGAKDKGSNCEVQWQPIDQYVVTSHDDDLLPYLSSFQLYGNVDGPGLDESLDIETNVWAFSEPHPNFVDSTSVCDSTNLFSDHSTQYFAVPPIPTHLYPSSPHPSLYPDFGTPLQNPSQPRRPSSVSNASYSVSDETYLFDKEKGRCPCPECGKDFKDLKAHMLTHQNERPEKCPIRSCDYHIKGFARKYDKNRHTLTHYKGIMVCGFCPGSGSASEKSFNRADVFKRHLTSVHAVEQTPPNGRKTVPGNLGVGKKPSGYASDDTGKCSTCSVVFRNAQDFYEHLDDCVLRIVQQEDPTEAINAARLAEIENKSLRDSAILTTTTNVCSADEEDEAESYDDGNDANFTLRSKLPHKGRGNRNPTSGVQKPRVPTHSEGGVTLNSKGRKKRKSYPPSWGIPPSQMKMKKRVLYVFDSPHRLWKDDMTLDTDYEMRMKLGNEKEYVTDLDVQMMPRVDGSKEPETHPRISDAVAIVSRKSISDMEVSPNRTDSVDFEPCNTL